MVKNNFEVKMVSRGKNAFVFVLTLLQATILRRRWQHYVILALSYTDTIYILLKRDFWSMSNILLNKNLFFGTYL